LTLRVMIWLGHDLRFAHELNCALCPAGHFMCRKHNSCRQAIHAPQGAIHCRDSKHTVSTYWNLSVSNHMEEYPFTDRRCSPDRISCYVKTSLFITSDCPHIPCAYFQIDRLTWI
jgi:hypothetical protein